MSELRVDNIVSQDGTAAPVYSKGILIGVGQTITDQGDFVVEGSTTLEGSLNVTNTGVATVAGRLNVTTSGISSFAGNVTIGGATTVTGRLDVLGGGALNTAGVITASLIDVTSEIQYANLAILTGNAGIGTTSGLGGRLNVNDDIVMSTGIGSVFDMAIRTYALDGGSISFEQVDGSSQFFSVSKDQTSILFAVNDATFNPQFVVGAGGSIGIGTTNPLEKLHVVPSSDSIAGLFSGTTTNDMVRITQGGTGNALLIEDETNPDSTPFIVTGIGSVGIGTTNPLSKLQVDGDARIGLNTSQGVILTSPNGTLYRLSVDNSGILTTTSV